MSSSPVTALGGASQQLPYPPGWGGDIINVTKNSKGIMENKYKINRL